MKYCHKDCCLHAGAEQRRAEAEAQRREWRQGLRAHIESQRAANQSPHKVMGGVCAPTLLLCKEGGDDRCVYRHNRNLDQTLVGEWELINQQAGKSSFLSHTHVHIHTQDAQANGLGADGEALTWAQLKVAAEAGFDELVRQQQLQQQMDAWEAGRVGGEGAVGRQGRAAKVAHKQAGSAAGA
eukprot:1157588-Pelagomonas_calceolata.AAC.14